MSRSLKVAPACELVMPQRQPQDKARCSPQGAAYKTKVSPYRWTSLTRKPRGMIIYRSNRSRAACAATVRSAIHYLLSTGQVDE